MKRDRKGTDSRDIGISRGFYIVIASLQASLSVLLRRHLSADLQSHLSLSIVSLRIASFSSCSQGKDVVCKKINIFDVLRG